MVEAKEFVDALKAERMGPCTGIPSGMLRGVIGAASSDPQLGYFTATSAAEAMGLAAGLALAGSMAVVLVGSSGLANALDPLTSLNKIYGLPVLLVISVGDEPSLEDEAKDAVRERMTPHLLAAIGVPYEYAANEVDALREQICRLGCIARESLAPVALLVKRGALAEENGPTYSASRCQRSAMSRSRAMQTIVQCFNDDDAVIASTGSIARELYNVNDRENNFYLSGAAGCASAVALGVALSQKHRRVVVLDGGETVLMHLGNIAAIGCYSPSKLIHIVLDSGRYDSAAGQPTLAKGVWLEGFPMSSGYTTVLAVDTEEGIRNFFMRITGRGPHFLRVVIAPEPSPLVAHGNNERGAEAGPARFQIRPSETAARFSAFLTRSCQGNGSSRLAKDGSPVAAPVG